MVFVRTFSRCYSTTEKIMRAIKRAVLGILFAFASMAAQATVLGNVDGYYYTGGVLYMSGWTCTYGSLTSITAYLYSGSTSGTLVTSQLANLHSEPAVGTSCGTTGSNYRFAMPITTAMMNSYGYHEAWVEGASTVIGQIDQQRIQH